MISSVPRELVELIAPVLEGKPHSFAPMEGGCINEGGKLVTPKDSVFIKWNDRHRYPGMFEAEARGLTLLRDAGVIDVPAVRFCGHAGSFQCLVLEFVEEGMPAPDYWHRLGVGLARMHRLTATTFGLDHDNYIGSLRQHNTPEISGVTFFIEHRLRKQLNKTASSEKGQALSEKFEKLFAKLPSLLPEEPPALLHGDLWRGNLITTRSGSPCLIDPAVYYGCREADLAMTQLFGGFDTSFLAYYDAEFPLINRYRERLDIYNLYPLLVHLNLFGESYRGQIINTLNRFI